MAVLSITEQWPDPANPQIRHFTLGTSTPDDTQITVQRSQLLPPIGHKHPVLDDMFAQDLDLKQSADNPQIWEATLTYVSGETKPTA
jgi:hypothetical protein